VPCRAGVVRQCAGTRVARVRPVILVRHGHAGNKSAWHHDDELRPLSARGRAQATSLVAAFAGDPVDAVSSSPATRCVQTLAPLAASRGLKVERTPLLAKDARADLLLEWLLAHSDAHWVVCTHGEVFAALLAVGLRAGVLVDPLQVTEKGAAWRVRRDCAARLDLEYLPPRLLASSWRPDETWRA